MQASRNQQATVEQDGMSNDITNNITNDEAQSYEALDYQLAKLFQQQNGKDNQTLKQYTLELSKHTREGQIYCACKPFDKTELLSTHIVGGSEDYKPLILDKGYLYLNRYFSYQKQLVQNIIERCSILDKEIPESLQTSVNQLFEPIENESINWQQQAAEQALKQSFLVLSGGPGTGKTTTISRILALLVEQNKQLEGTENHRDSLRVLLAAPTGKAAIRLLDSLQSVQSTMDLTEQARAQMPKQASTLHKLLGYQPNSIQFKHNQDNPLPADVVVIDEASMIDIAMMTKLFAAVPKEAILILVGDKDQLSSVEIGSVFTDICNGLQNTNKLVTLQKNWRFSNDSGIGQLSKSVNKGDANLVLNILESDVHSDCCLVSPRTIAPPKIPKLLIEPWLDYFKVLNHPNSTLDEIFSAFNEYRVLCALRRGLNGSQLLTDRIETEITKLGYIKKPSSSWYHGRPIMITQNSYSRGLYNGDVGIALRVDKQIKVYFPNTHQSPDDGNVNQEANQENYKSFAPVRLPAHETTWAMTIHKSQGSEFNQVTLVLPEEVMPLLTKQLIYTGVTRAKKHVSIIVEADILSAGIKIEATQATRVGEALSSAML